MTNKSSDDLPSMSDGLCSLPVMGESTSRAILAANLRKLIEADTPQGERPSVRAWALGRNLDVRMIDRLIKAEHAVTLDKLEEIATACGLQPWHLLIEDFTPGAPPDAPISDEERQMLKKLRRILEL